MKQSMRFLAACVVVAAGSAGAVTYTWNNAAGGNFATNTNWTPNGSPGGSDTVYLNTAGTYQIDFTGAAATADALWQPAGATMTLALAGNTWTSGRILAGYAVSGNSFTVSGGTLTAANHFALGAGGAGGGNSMAVSGASSVLRTNSFDLGVGYYIDGGNVSNSNTLTVSAGGTALSSRTVYIGRLGASGNTVTVTGTNSKLQATSTIEVDGSGGGNGLRIENGGLASGNSWLGGTGNSVVVDNGTWSAPSYLYVRGSANTATVQNGGAMTAGDVRVGHTETGGNTLTITGGTVTGTGHFCIGTSGSANNTVLVTGASSLLKTNSFDVAVGSYAGGTGGGNNNLLRVENGGQVTVARTLFAGAGTTAGNAVRVSGTGSTIGAQNVDVRGSGGGNRLDVLSGGTVSATGNADLRDSGNAIVVDGGTLTANGALTVAGTSNTVTARNAGVLTGGNAWFGRGSTTSGAALSVESGAVVTGSGHLVVGYDGAVGTTATVSGLGSLLKCNSWDLGIGNYSGGATNTANGTTVTVSAGGEIRAQRTLFIGAGTTSGNTLTVTGTGSLARAMTTSIEVGGTGGSNRLTLQSGGSANAASVVLGGTNNSLAVDNGTLTGTYLYTRGTGNTMSVSNGGTVTFGQIEVGNGGSGAVFNVTGGTVTATGHFYTGTGSGTGSSVTVSGPTAQVKTNAYDFHVGYNGTNNTMTLSGGATAVCPRLTYVGETNTATGNRLIITGAGSQFTNGTNYWSDHIYVGNATAGNNQIQVSNGGTLDCFSILVGTAAGNAVTNTGGTYQFRMVAPTLTPGAGGISLTDGTISYRSIPDVNVNSNVTGTLANITFAGNNTFMMNNSYSQGYTDQTYTYDSLANTGNPKNYQKLAMVNGTTSIPLGAITIGSGGAFLAENTAATISQTLANSGALDVRSGASLAVGTFTQSAGSSTIHGTLSSTNPLVFSGGVLGGTGTLSAPSVSLSNTTVGAGSSPGTLTVAGAYSQAASVTLLVELEGLTQGVSYDWLNISGAASLAGTLAVSAATEPWFLDYGQTFTVLSAAGGITDGGLLLGGPSAGWFSMSVGPTDVVLTSLIPEPGAALLLALAGVGLAARRGRRRAS